MGEDDFKHNTEFTIDSKKWHIVRCVRKIKGWSINPNEIETCLDSVHGEVFYMVTNQSMISTNLKNFANSQYEASDLSPELAWHCYSLSGKVETDDIDQLFK